MSLKAAESSMIIPFVIDELMTHGGDDVFGGQLIGAGVALQTLLKTMRMHRTVVPAHGCLQMRRSMDMHIRCCEAAEVALVPKHHLACHLVDRTAFWCAAD